MPVLRPEPDLFDLQGWKERLADLRADGLQDEWQRGLIDHAQAHIEALEGGSPQRPTEAA